MKKIFMMIAILTLVAGCSQESSYEQTFNTLTLKGYSHNDNNDVRTTFGDPSASQIPFLWSAGDYIWAGTYRSTALEAECKYASFTFTPAPSVIGHYHIFYNITGESNQALIPAKQSQAGEQINLGANGDFGYAESDDFGTFCLNHKCAYVWFAPTTSLPELKVASITLFTTSTAIAGEATYDHLTGSWSAVSEGEQSITLTFDEPRTITATSEGIFAAMVLYPANLAGEQVTILYTFADGSTYTEQRNGRTLIAGDTLRIASEITAVEESAPEADYTLRTLTFEDEDTKFEAYECEFYFPFNFMDPYVYQTVEKWSDYIPRDGQYGNGHGAYEWYDQGNTELAFIKPEIESWWGISGHAGISDYVGSDYVNEGNYMYDLQAYNVTGGANGSKNFCSQYGYLDPEEYATQYSPQGVLPGLQFYDGVARVIESMYVTNTTYAYKVLVSGECDFGGSYEYTDDSTFKIVAYGYDSMDDTEPTIAEFYLLNTGKRMVTEWTKWDLSGLGEVVKVEFNLVACDNGYGIYGNVIPAYFAYDDIVVRFPKETSNR